MKRREARCGDWHCGGLFSFRWKNCLYPKAVAHRRAGRRRKKTGCTLRKNGRSGLISGLRNFYDWERGMSNLLRKCGKRLSSVDCPSENIVHIWHESDVRN
ncbi:MAG: hypothetical protein II038_02760 [Lachnospiraceae bacterium]|nr:hypothetical protein [Lachnospiraceae bacterium]